MVGVVGRVVRAAGRRVVRAVAVVALVGAATLAGATAAHADPPPFGQYPPQDGLCVGALSDADCWHYTDTYRTPEDCKIAGWGFTFGYDGSVACTSSGRAGNTELWIYSPDADCPGGATADQCNPDLREPRWNPWGNPTPVDG